MKTYMDAAPGPLLSLITWCVWIGCIAALLLLGC